MLKQGLQNSQRAGMLLLQEQDQAVVDGCYCMGVVLGDVLAPWV
jgi:hypothetical protein